MAPLKINRIIFVYNSLNISASVRIHCQAAESALRENATFSVKYRNPSGEFAPIYDTDCVVFPYNDLHSVSYVRKNKIISRAGLVLCFGSDIYNFFMYQSLMDICDAFIMPSEAHTKVLGLAVSVPVRTVREGIDSIATWDPANGRASSGRSLVWFGYPESYYKGMRYIEPIIRMKLDGGQLDRFCLVTDKRGLDPRSSDFEVITFSTTDFSDVLSQFNYAILSHFPGDLHVNSHIKSPNKLITAISAGLMPIATNTPNYNDLMCKLSLESFLFSSLEQLSRIIDALVPERDQQIISRIVKQQRLNTLSNTEFIAKDVIDIVNELAPHVQSIRAFNFTCSHLITQEDESYLGIKASASSLLKAIGRFAIKRL